MFIQRLRDGISKLVRSFVANIDEMVGPHYCRDGAIYTPEQGERHSSPLISRFLRQPGNQGLFEIQKYKIVQLAGFIPGSLLRRVCQETRADEHVGGSTFLARYSGREIGRASCRERV